MQKIIISLKKLDNTDISKIAYPLIIFLTGWYIVANFYRLATIWSWFPVMIFYTTAWMLVTIGFIYLYYKKIRLIFRWSLLSIIGIILIIVFTLDAVFLIIDPYIQIEDILLTGQWDHTFFPLAFGLFFLCDFQRIPKKFWYFLLLFAMFNLIPNLNVISNLVFNKWVLQAPGEGGPPGFNFFNVNNWTEFNNLPRDSNFLKSIANYLEEQLTFFTLFPAVVIKNTIKKQENKDKIRVDFSLNQF